jgi:rod shape-determining protein MreD
VSFFKVLIAIAAVLMVQTMVLDNYQWLSGIDLFLLLNVYFALNFGQMVCMSVSVGSGLVQDVFSNGIIGMNAFSKTIVVFLISGLSSRLMLKQPLVVMLLIFLSTCLDFLSVYGLNALFGLSTQAISWQVFLSAGLLNSLIGLISFQVADRFRTKREYV